VRGNHHSPFRLYQMRVLRMDGAKMIVTLDPWEYEHARHVASMRESINRNQNNAAHYNPDLMQDNLYAETAACVSELAVAKHLNIYWSGAYWPVSEHHLHADEPDLFPDIEVRHITSAHHNLAIRLRDVQRNRMMVCAYPNPDNHSVVTLVGWVYAKEGWEEAAPATFDRTGTTRLYPRSRLKGFS
jgi:hypothetical protein